MKCKKGVSQLKKGIYQIGVCLFYIKKKGVENNETNHKIKGKT